MTTRMHPTRIQRLAASFPALATRPESFETPWDAEAFARAWASGSSGQRHAALFVLGVWNRNTDWREFGLVGGDGTGRFNVHLAFNVWDWGNIEAFLRWARDPWLA